MTSVQEIPEVEKYIYPFYNNFHSIVQKLLFGCEGFKGYIWVMEAPSFKLGEARYYPIRYKGDLIKTDIIDYTNNAIGIGRNAIIASNQSIAIGTSAICRPVGIGSYKPSV